MAMRYLSYQLALIAGVGHQPYREIEEAGAAFDGGHFASDDGSRIGYLTGTQKQTDAAIAVIGLWQPVELTADELLAHVEALLPKFGAVSIGSDGRVVFANPPRPFQ